MKALGVSHAYGEDLVCDVLEMVATSTGSSTPRRTIDESRLEKEITDG